MPANERAGEHKRESTMASKRSVTVVQRHNPKFDSTKPKHETENPEQIYEVVKAVNYLGVKISENLNPAQVIGLIGLGIDVTVNPVK
jgi:hypothetical protein